MISLGLVEIVKEAYTDHTQFDQKDPHYDPKSSKVRFYWYFFLSTNRNNLIMVGGGGG